MAGHFITDAERERLSNFPPKIEPDDVITFFTLSSSDKELVCRRSGDIYRLGFALQLCSLRYLGFPPKDFTTIPIDVINYVSGQLGVVPDISNLYDRRLRTRTDQLQEIMTYLGFRKADSDDLRILADWLVERALEHDRPSLLFQMACDRLYTEKIVRPGVTVIERMVASVRYGSQQETYNRILPLLTDERRDELDALLIPDAVTGRTTLNWLRHESTSNTSTSILNALDRFAFLQKWDVNHWDLSTINPNRLKMLARLGRGSSNQALQRTPEERRYPILVAFVHQSIEDITDEIIDIYDCCLSQSYSRAGRKLKEFRHKVARSTNQKLILFQELGRILLDPTVTDSELREVIYQHIPMSKLSKAVEECEQLIRPLDDNYFDFLSRHYSYIRQFSSVFLGIMDLRSNITDDPLLEAINLLRQVNRESKRKIPEDATLEFVPPKWYPYVVNDAGKISRRYYELCVLWELRGALRAGNIWLEGSRQYTNPENYLISKSHWPSVKTEVCRQLHVPENGSERFQQRQEELETLLERLDKQLPDMSKVRLDGKDLVISPFEADDVPENSIKLQQQITKRLPRVDIADLLIEADSWTHFTDFFEHAGGSQPRTKEQLIHLYAAILAQACNFGATIMSEISDLSYDQLAWYTNWYIRDETLRSANTAIVNFQYHQSLGRIWGGGTFSSSDGQRFPVSVKTRNATALPRYFGYGRGLTFYTWTSDQFSQYGTKVIPATVRDATYVLDEILDNETELPIIEHTTDTLGFTELVFALFDLLGLQFSPRIRDIGDQRLYRIDATKTYPNLKPLIKGKINRDRILKRWDDFLRVAGSLNMGWVTASLLIGKLQSYPRQNTLTRSLQEYGRLIKTIFILRYLDSEEYRRRIGSQINKGESMNSLRGFLFFANEGLIRQRYQEDQTNQALCLNILTNAVITWNTVYMAAIINQLKAEGYPVQESNLEHLSPARFEHINRYGKYNFDIDKWCGRKTLRPLRQK